MPHTPDHTGQASPNHNGPRPPSSHYRSSTSSPYPSRSSSRPSSGTSSSASNSHGHHAGQQRQETMAHFWPNTVTLGSRTGNQFTKLFHAPCKIGIDKPDPNFPRRKAWPYSFVSFDFKRELLVFKCTPMVQREEYNRLPPVMKPLDCELPWSDIASHGIDIEEVKSEDGRQHVVVTATCRRPPRYYTKFEEPDDRLYRRRATEMDFTLSDKTEKHAGILNPLPDGSAANPTFWNSFRWTFAFDQQMYSKFLACTGNLRNCMADMPEQILAPQPARQIPSALSSHQWLAPDLTGLSFHKRAIVEGLLAIGILLRKDVPVLLEALTQHAPAERLSLRVLESLFTEERIRHPSSLVYSRAMTLRNMDPPKVLEHLVMIRTVQVTPTRVLIGPLQPETSNSVTRRYADKLDAIIRVQFVDEGDRLYVFDYAKRCDDIRDDVGLMARVRRALQHGILVAGKRFYPVASSASQQKEHSVWFINHQEIAMTELLNWMGRVEETVVAKHSARLGLPFSATRMADVQIDMWRHSDIEINGHCFTDGVSIAGTQIMTAAAEVLKLSNPLDLNPSAVQFRLGGAKGVLSCWPNMVGPRAVLLRPSQIKFDSDGTELNVIRTSRYQSAFLNRQFIIIMEANGVPSSLFIEIFKDAVRQVRKMHKRAEAGELLPEDITYMKSFTEFPVATLIKHGFNQNPFVRDVVRLVQCRALQDLKWRARVRLSGGVYLIGIADESNTLKEGELFCQFQPRAEDKPVVVTGEVLICRAPALHPGDVRRAMAVDCPKLRHLKNVIVFSTRGKRPLPNMLGGGDLDGDDYTLIWDQRFVQPLKEYPPMDYTAPEPIKVRNVTQTHLNENFVQYLINDVLGRVDNAHLANCDRYTPFHEVCLELSEIHSTAVDFAKTGVAAQLDPEHVPTKWPDFMGKPESDTYFSGKILGVLFRLVDLPREFKPTDILLTDDHNLHPGLTNLPIDGLLLDTLRNIKAWYEHSLQYAMRRFSVHEAELVTGLPVQSKRRKRSRELNHLHEPFKDVYDHLFATVREQAEDAALAFPQEGYTALQVAAWHAYQLTYVRPLVEQWQMQLFRQRYGIVNDPAAFETGRELPLTSFAWIFAEEIVHIVSMRGE